LKKLNKRPSKGLNKQTIKEDKFIKITDNDSINNFNKLGKMIENKEIKWIYYKKINSVGTHYYIKLKIKNDIN
jgi:hypothetical protein